jgi:DNA recombination protein RmuC
VPELALVAAGVLVGAVTGWALGRAQARARAAAESQALGTRLAVAESMGDELRKQLTQRDYELGELRQGLSAERAQRLSADARGEALRENLEEQRRLLGEARERLGDTFRALGADVLRESGALMVERARESIDAQLARRQEAIDALVRPLTDALARYEAGLRSLESSRQHAYGTLEEHLRTLARGQVELQRETGNLVNALRVPHVRGRWGELTLRRVVELAGLVAHCDFVEQVTVEGEGGRLRPDMVVRLPAGREILVDAKVPLTAYLEAAAAETPEARRAALVRHAQQVRQHMNGLAAKAYWDEFGRSAELVVMFIPGEPFVAAAAEADAALIEDGLARKVVIATPATLVAVLRAIAFGWRQEQVARGAEEISKLGAELYERVRTLGGHFDDLGKSLAKTTAAFNRAVGSMESRVLPAARRFRDLGTPARDEIPVLEPLDQLPRELNAPEFPRQLDAPELTP